MKPNPINLIKGLFTAKSKKSAMPNSEEDFESVILESELRLSPSKKSKLRRESKKENSPLAAAGSLMAVQTAFKLSETSKGNVSVQLKLDSERSLAATLKDIPAPVRNEVTSSVKSKAKSNSTIGNFPDANDSISEIEASESKPSEVFDPKVENFPAKLKDPADSKPSANSKVVPESAEQSRESAKHRVETELNPLLVNRNAALAADAVKPMASSNRKKEPNSESSQHTGRESAKAQRSQAGSQPGAAAYESQSNTDSDSSSNSQNEFGSQTSAQASRAKDAVHSPQFTGSHAKLSAEQIREIQAMVQRALEKSRGNSLQSGEVAFEWNPGEMGKLRFEFSTQDSNVQVKILAEKPHVIELIEQTKAVVERMIADQGLKLERLEVVLQDSSSAPEDPRAGRNGNESESREGRSAQDSSAAGSGPDSPEAASSDRPHLTGDRQWTA